MLIRVGVFLSVVNEKIMAVFAPFLKGEDRLIF